MAWISCWGRLLWPGARVGATCYGLDLVLGPLAMAWTSCWVHLLWPGPRVRATCYGLDLVLWPLAMAWSWCFGHLLWPILHVVVTFYCVDQSCWSLFMACNTSLLSKANTTVSSDHDNNHSQLYRKEFYTVSERNGGTLKITDKILLTSLTYKYNFTSTMMTPMTMIMTLRPS